MVGRMCAALVAGLISLYGGGVAAMIPDWPQSGWVWAEEQSSDLSGARLFQRELSVPLPPAALARVLSKRLPQFNRLMVLDQQILLSGLDGTHHWMARIARDAAGARAMISALALEAVELGHEKFDPALYVPAESRLQFSHAQTLDGQRVVQVIYESVRSPSVLVQQVERALLQAGWHRQQGLQVEEGLLWRRAGERVHVRAHEQAGGSVLWLQHQEAGTP